MQVIDGYLAAGSALAGAALAIGNFDGLHRGHRSLFAEARRVAGREGTAAVLTFEPHPVRVLAPHLAPSLLMTLEEKLAGLEALGVDAVVVQPFDRVFAGMAPSEFVQAVLIEGLRVGHVVVGPDFSFGRGGKGGTALLEQLLSGAGVGLSVMPPVKEGGLVCSSSQIRQFLLMGNVDAAALLLGHPYWVEGEVVAGDGRGKKLGIPTANLATPRETIPRVGVYATWAAAAGGLPYPSVTNVGLRPTFAGSEPGGVRIEAHLLDFPRAGEPADLYGQRLRLWFMSRLRDEQRFPSVDALRARIDEDVRLGRAHLADHPLPAEPDARGR